VEGNPVSDERLGPTLEQFIEDEDRYRGWHVADVDWGSDLGDVDWSTFANGEVPTAIVIVPPGHQLSRFPREDAAVRGDGFPF
jgi:hypothetical protein